MSREKLMSNSREFPSQSLATSQLITMAFIVSLLYDDAIYLLWQITKLEGDNSS